MLISNPYNLSKITYDFFKEIVVSNLVTRNQTSNSLRNIGGRSNQLVINDDALKQEYSIAFDKHFEVAEEMALKLPTGGLLTYALAPTVGLAPLSIIAGALAIGSQDSMPTKMSPFILTPLLFCKISDKSIFNLVCDMLLGENVDVNDSIVNLTCGMILGDTVVINNSKKNKLPVTIGFGIGTMTGAILTGAAYIAFAIGKEIVWGQTK